MKRFTSIHDYHKSFGEPQRSLMQDLRAIIQQAAPDAVEQISYNMPSFKKGKVICYYAAYKNHIGFYPTSGPIEALKQELANYQFSKGAVQFPITKKIPVGIVKKLVKARLKMIGS
ncbi:MAG: DUF1801 domain-containing protein [Chitinophagaceae bacterium]|nr:DUF1801 domain-containing protein [Chitinophagaceae bacterium]